MILRNSFISCDLPQYVIHSIHYISSKHKIMQIIRFIIAFLLIFISLTSFAQMTSMLSEAIEQQIKAEVAQEALLLQKHLDSLDIYISDEDKAKMMEFQLDTFKVEAALSKRLNQDYSTLGMVSALGQAYHDYDVLLNKYYKLIMNNLSESDKVVFRQAQRSWLAYRDAERTFIYTLSDEKYTGGGTIQKIITADIDLEMIRKRVNELFSHWSRMGL